MGRDITSIDICSIEAAAYNLKQYLLRPRIQKNINTIEIVVFVRRFNY